MTWATWRRWPTAAATPDRRPISCCTLLVLRHRIAVPVGGIAGCTGSGPRAGAGQGRRPGLQRARDGELHRRAFGACEQSVIAGFGGQSCSHPAQLSLHAGCCPARSRWEAKKHTKMPMNTRSRARCAADEDARSPPLPPPRCRRRLAALPRDELFSASPCCPQSSWGVFSPSHSCISK